MMDVREIREYLPHRYPFLLVDRVVELVEGDMIRAYTNVSRSMAQAAGILGFKSIGKKPSDGSIYLFAGADNVRFKRQVTPGDRLDLEAKIVSERRGIWKFECRATVDGTLAASATIICADRVV